MWTHSDRNLNLSPENHDTIRLTRPGSQYPSQSLLTYLMGHVKQRKQNKHWCLFTVMWNVVENVDISCT